MKREKRDVAGALVGKQYMESELPYYNEKENHVLMKRACVRWDGQVNDATSPKWRR